MLHKGGKLKTNPGIEPPERCWLLTGPSGTGKSSLAETLAADTSGDPIEAVWQKTALNLEIVNGRSCHVDRVRDRERNGVYRPMGGGLRVQLAAWSTRSSSSSWSGASQKRSPWFGRKHSTASESPKRDNERRTKRNKRSRSENP